MPMLTFPPHPLQPPPLRCAAPASHQDQTRPLSLCGCLLHLLNRESEFLVPITSRSDASQLFPSPLLLYVHQQSVPSLNLLFLLLLLKWNSANLPHLQVFLPGGATNPFQFPQPVSMVLPLAIAEVPCTTIYLLPASFR